MVSGWLGFTKYVPFSLATPPQLAGEKAIKVFFGEKSFRSCFYPWKHSKFRSHRRTDLRQFLLWVDSQRQANNFQFHPMVHCIALLPIWQTSQEAKLWKTRNAKVIWRTGDFHVFLFFILLFIFSIKAKHAWHHADLSLFTSLLLRVNFQLFMVMSCTADCDFLLLLTRVCRALSLNFVKLLTLIMVCKRWKFCSGGNWLNFGTKSFDNNFQCSNKYSLKQVSRGSVRMNQLVQWINKSTLKAFDVMHGNLCKPFQSHVKITYDGSLINF